VLHSYELIARHVKPHFQGSLVNLQASQAWSSKKRDALMALRAQAIDKAKQAYFEPTPSA
jgi:hypothetical protein